MDGKRRYLYQADWQEWQRIKWPTETKYPLPTAEVLGKCWPKTVELFRQRCGRTGEVFPLHAYARNASASADAPADALEEGQGETISKSLISGQSKPMNWGKIHGNHVSGFCDWVCLPDFIFNEFAAKSGQLNAEAWTKDWALSVRRVWEGRPIGDDSLVFWRARWAEFLGTTKTATGGGVDVLAGLR